MVVADIDCSFAIDALQACTETLTLTVVVNRLKNVTQGAVDPVFGNLGAVFSPVGFHQAVARVLRVYGKALLAPEFDNLRINRFGRLLDNQDRKSTLLNSSH